MNQTIQPSADILRVQSQKLTQSKLFQKFLLEESSKPSPKPSPFKLKISPFKPENFPTPREHSIESSRLYSEHSEIQGFSQHIFASSPDKHFTPYQDYQEYMTFSNDPYKDPPPYNNPSSTNSELEKLKQEFIQVLNDKDQEMNKLKKDLESSRLDVIELEDRLRESNSQECYELERKISSLVEQNQKLLEFNRNTSIEAKNRANEVESELRLVKQRNEELIRDYLREKEKNDMLEVRISTLKERASVLDSTNQQMQDRIILLERELDSCHRDTPMTKKRTEGNVFIDVSPNTTRNFYEEYRGNRPPPEEPLVNRPRNVSAQEQHWPRATNDRSPLQRQSLEQKLDSLVQDKQRLEKEFSKLPDVCKNVATKRRKEELELELEIIDTNIHNVKSKIRNRIRQLN